MIKTSRHFQSVRSTNDSARLWARDASNPAPHGAVVSADEQTGGRGRHGRDWVSPAGKGVYLSMIWRPEISPAQVGRLPLVTALAAARALEEVAGLRIETKWPNDLLREGKKIGGILCESEVVNSKIEFIIAGVGLNVNFQEEDFPERTVFPATSLLMQTRKEWPVEDVRNACARALELEYSRYARGEWESQRGEFIARCAIIGEVVRVRNNEQEYSAVATGIDSDGVLLVQTSSGINRVVAGDVLFGSVAPPL